MDVAIFRACSWLGATPFAVVRTDGGDGGHGARLTTRMASWHTPYFLLVLGLFHFYLVLNVTKISEQSGNSFLAYTMWIGAAFVACATLWSVLLKRGCIKACFASLQRHKNDKSYGVEAKINRICWIWLVLGCLFSLGVVLVHNIRCPDYPLFITSMLCYDGDDGGVSGFNIYYSPCFYLGLVAQSLSLLQYFGICLMNDLIPLCHALAFREVFGGINAELRELSDEFKSADVERGGIGDLPLVAKAAPIDGCKKPEVGGSARLQRLLRRYQRALVQLHLFNKGYSPLVLTFVSHIFVMCVCVFFVAIKLKVADMVELISIIINGVEYLIRGSIVLYVFGSVRETCCETKRILLSEFPLSKLSPIYQEVLLFSAHLDDAYVSAGSYIYFSKGFLITFYGVLATYVAIGVQSL